MIKRNIVASLVITVFILPHSLINAQIINPTILPNAGLTPSSPFYFFEMAVEAVEEFLTFNTESKANLQINRALERISEVDVMLIGVGERGINEESLNVAIGKIESNITRAAEIIQNKHEKGEDVSALAKKLDTNFEINKRLLDIVFEERGEQIEIVFNQKIQQFKQELLDAMINKDIELVNHINLNINNLKQEKEAQEILIDQVEERIEFTFEREEERFELVLEEKERKFELKEREARVALELNQRELERKFEEIEKAVELEEDLLKYQFNTSILTGDIQAIEKTKAKLNDFLNKELRYTSQFEEVERALEEVDQNFEILLLKEERSLEDFIQHEELNLKKSETVMSVMFEKKRVVLENKFEAIDNKLYFEESNLKLQISNIRDNCQLAIDPNACLLEKVNPLKERLTEVQFYKDQVNLGKYQAEKELEVKENLAEQALNLKEKEAERGIQIKERELEIKEKELEKEMKNKESELKYEQKVEEY